MNPLSSLHATRRGFLSLAASSAALAAMARLPAASALPANHSGAAFFSDQEREILTRVVERVVATGEPDAPAVRETSAIEVIDQILITQVTTRPLTLEEIRQKGILFGEDDFKGFEFMLAMKLDSKPVNVNFSARHLKRPDVVEEVLETLRQTKLPPAKGMSP